MEESPFPPQTAIVILLDEGALEEAIFLAMVSYRLRTEEFFWPAFCSLSTVL